jgi:hypothetical protein
MRLQKPNKLTAARQTGVPAHSGPGNKSPKCLLHFLELIRGSAIGSTPAFGAGYPGSSPGPGAKYPVRRGGFRLRAHARNAAQVRVQAPEPNILSAAADFACGLTPATRLKFESRPRSQFQTDTCQVQNGQVTAQAWSTRRESLGAIRQSSSGGAWRSSAGLRCLDQAQPVRLIDFRGATQQDFELAIGY